jgi:uncharacterized membrane protein
MPLKTIIAIVTLSYPAAVYFGLQAFEPKLIAILLLAVAGIRLLALDKNPLNHWAWLPAIAILALWSVSSNSDTGIKLYPVLVNLSFLALFAWSLKSGPPIIERLARLTEPNLPASGVQYTRQVTVIWCVFFFINGSISAYTVWLENAKIWALYNGLVSYLLMGSLFSIEWLVRRVVKARHHD